MSERRLTTTTCYASNGPRWQSSIIHKFLKSPPIHLFCYFSPASSVCVRVYVPVCIYLLYVCMVITDWVSTGMVANPARGQLNREKKHFEHFFCCPCPLSCLRIWSRENRFSRPVPRQPAQSGHTQTESGVQYNQYLYNYSLFHQ